jgi:AbrB family looped-hinge helix DNA binding protein
MRTTIDKAGRVVIPAALRERAGLVPGSELEVTEDDRGIRLERVAAGPRLVKVGRRLVARPTVSADRRPSIDIASIIEDERNRWP